MANFHFPVTEVTMMAILAHATKSTKPRYLAIENDTATCWSRRALRGHYVCTVACEARIQQRGRDRRSHPRRDHSKVTLAWAVVSGRQVGVWPDLLSTKRPTRLWQGLIVAYTSRISSLIKVSGVEMIATHCSPELLGASSSDGGSTRVLRRSAG